MAPAYRTQQCMIPSNISTGQHHCCLSNRQAGTNPVHGCNPCAPAEPLLPSTHSPCGVSPPPAKTQFGRLLNLCIQHNPPPPLSLLRTAPTPTLSLTCATNSPSCMLCATSTATTWLLNTKYSMPLRPLCSSARPSWGHEKWMLIRCCMPALPCIWIPSRRLQQQQERQERQA
jgi:hypothetical protein